MEQIKSYKYNSKNIIKYIALVLTGAIIGATVTLVNIDIIINEYRQDYQAEYSNKKAELIERALKVIELEEQ